MSVRNTAFVPKEYYHIYNRGNSKQRIFLDQEDYLRFIALLFASNQKSNLKVGNLQRGQTLYDVERGKSLVNIGAYCLMPNHFHLLITQLEDGGVSAFMQKVSTAYSMYFNKKYKRTGSLFEGKFKSQHLSVDRYLKYIFSYIHLNPIKLIQSDWKEKGIYDQKSSLNYLKGYLYSSYLDYIGEKRIQNKILSIETFPKYFPNKASFNKEIFEWMHYNT